MSGWSVDAVIIDEICEHSYCVFTSQHTFYSASIVYYDLYGMKGCYLYKPSVSLNEVFVPYGTRR